MSARLFICNVEEVHLGFRVPLIGWLVDRVLTFVLPLAELRRHVREEGENFACLLDADTDGG